MTRPRYELALGATVVEAARTAVAKQLPRHLPAVQEPPREIRELIARLVALDSVDRAVGRRAVTSLSLQLPPPQATPRRG